MKIIKNIIEYLIAISVIPAIVLTVISVTELKDVRNVQYELLSEEEGIYNITPGTYEKLVANKRIKNYELESNYPLITHEDMERATWKLNDDLKNEMYIDENGQKRIIVNVGQNTYDGSDDEDWMAMPEASHSGYYAMYIEIPNVVVTSMVNSYNIPNTYQYALFRDATEITIRPYTEGLSIKLPGTNEVEFRQYLSQNPLIVTYELVVKNPNTMIIESRDIFVTSDYVRLTKPNDFSNNSDGLLITSAIYDVDRFEIVNNWIYVYPRENITVTQLANRMVGSTLIYELSQPRLAEVYDFSKFRLVFDKNRIRVVFDVDDGYYLWEITKDDKMIPINGRHDLGNIWTVKFYVYEIQQPLIRTLVLLIPLIVVSGVLLYMFNIIKKKGISY